MKCTRVLVLNSFTSSWNFRKLSPAARWVNTAIFWYSSFAGSLHPGTTVGWDTMKSPPRCDGYSNCIFVSFIFSPLFCKGEWCTLYSRSSLEVFVQNAQGVSMAQVQLPSVSSDCKILFNENRTWYSCILCQCAFNLRILQTALGSVVFHAL